MDPNRIWTAALVVIGDEILSGRTQDKNIAQIAAWLNVQGIRLAEVRVVDDDGASAADWLDRAHEAEQRADRIREVHWGPRTLDVDVVTVTDEGVEQRSADPVLTLPHPRSAERAFVLVPWYDVDPAAEVPGHGPVAELAAAVDRQGVERRDDLEPRLPE